MGEAVLKVTDAETIRYIASRNKCSHQNFEDNNILTAKYFYARNFFKTEPITCVVSALGNRKKTEALIQNGTD